MKKLIALLLSRGNVPQPAKYVHWLLDLMFSVYCALLIVTEENIKESSILHGKLAHPLLFLYRLLADLLHWRHFSFHSYRDMAALLWCWWFVLAAIIFVCMRLFGRSALMRRFLRYATGLVTVAGFPLIWLNLGNMTGRSLVAARWLGLEVAVIVVCVFIYLDRKWSMSAALGILVLVLHFGFWGWVTWGDRTIGYPSVHLVPGACVSLIWSFYVSLSTGSHLPAMPPAA
jgi:hypothetical protein